MKHKYRSLADMEDDVMLLCQNARTYNKIESQIYADSQELETGFLTARAQLDSSLLEAAPGDSDEEPYPEVGHVTWLARHHVTVVV